jgi:hypothetical protein
MKDEDLKLEEIEASHTLGWAGEVSSVGGIHGKTIFVCLFAVFTFVYLFYWQLDKKRRRSEGKKCHAKTMMNTKADKSAK